MLQVCHIYSLQGIAESGWEPLVYSCKVKYLNKKQLYPELHGLIKIESFWVTEICLWFHSVLYMLHFHFHFSNISLAQNILSIICCFWCQAENAKLSAWWRRGGAWGHPKNTPYFWCCLFSEMSQLQVDALNVWTVIRFDFRLPRKCLSFFGSRESCDVTLTIR